MKTKESSKLDEYISTEHVDTMRTKCMIHDAQNTLRMRVMWKLREVLETIAPARIQNMVLTPKYCVIDSFTTVYIIPYAHLQEY